MQTGYQSLGRRQRVSCCRKHKWTTKDTLFLSVVVDLCITAGCFLHWQLSELPAPSELSEEHYGFPSTLLDVCALALLRAVCSLSVACKARKFDGTTLGTVTEWTLNAVVLYLLLPKLLAVLFGPRHTETFVWLFLGSQALLTVLARWFQARAQRPRPRATETDDEEGLMQIALERNDSGASVSFTETADGAPKPPNEQIDVDPVDQWTAARMLAKGLWRHGGRLRIAMVILFNLIAAICQTLRPRLVGVVIDESDDTDAALMLLNYIVLLMVIEQVLNGSMRKMEQDQSALMERGYGIEAMEKLGQLEMAFFDNSTSGELTSRITNDISSMTERLKWTWPDVPNLIGYAVAALYFMLQMNVRLTIVSFACIPLSLFISKKFGDYLFRVNKEASDLNAERTKIVTECVGAMRTIKNFGAEEHMAERFRESAENYYNLTRQRNVWWGVNDFSWGLWPKLTQVGTLLVFVKFCLPAGDLTIGELSTFLMYQNELCSRMNHFGICYASLMQIIGTAAKIFGIMKREPRIRYDGLLQPADFTGSIEFKNVTFAYPTRKEKTVLDKFELKVAAGEMVALVGGTGCGKSTILRLLQRLYLPEKGTVKIDGVNVDDISHSRLHQLVSIVEQEPTLFATSVKENILFGLQDLPEDERTDERIIAAARKANAHEFIEKLPYGYDTQVGERGVQLSGGQKQRIGIARALVRDPKILLLDEATSALDAEAEAVVQEAIERVMKGRTVVVVAHRLSTVRNAHRICVMQPDENDIGRIVEAGSHEELLDSKLGVYRGLVERQLA